MSIASAGPGAGVDDSPSASSGWLVGPWFDLLLVANVAWPLLLLVQHGEGFGGRDGLQFWQVYYVTTPHRWITLLLVFLDRERFQSRRGLFVGLAVVAVAVCAGVRLTTGTLTCLLTIDYLWNAWHFAAQHHGIYRIYTRGTGVPNSPALRLEKWGLRLFLLYAIVRIATATWANRSVDSWLRSIDWFAILVPAALVASDLLRRRGRSLAGTCYLVSVCALYLCILGAIRAQRPMLVLALATASALFHATEYLALVTWSVRRRHGSAGNRMGLLGYLAPRWGLALGTFVLILGAAAWLMETNLLETWLFINVVVAFLHYTYDGLIWRHRPTFPSPTPP